MRHKTILYAFFAFLAVVGLVVAITSPYWVVAWGAGFTVGFIGVYGIRCLVADITLDDIIKEIYGEE